MNFVNLTPHRVNLNNGRFFDPSGTVARVSTSMNCVGGILFSQVFGSLLNLPKEEIGTMFIVSGLVLAAAKAIGRSDCVAPATAHPDTRRDDGGRIISVPGFVI